MQLNDGIRTAYWWIIMSGTNNTSLSDILFALSDEDSLKIFDMIANRQRDPKISDFESPKRYYNRMSKLKNARVIRKNGKSYKITAFGSIVYKTIQMIKIAHELHWKLEVIDAISENVPVGEYHSIVESMIPDKSVRNTLIELRELHSRR